MGSWGGCCWGGGAARMEVCVMGVCGESIRYRV